LPVATAENNFRTPENETRTTSAGFVNPTEGGERAEWKIIKSPHASVLRQIQRSHVYLFFSLNRSQTAKAAGIRKTCVSFFEWPGRMRFYDISLRPGITICKKIFDISNKNSYISSIFIFVT